MTRTSTNVAPPSPDLADLVEHLTTRLQAGEVIDSAVLMSEHPEHAGRLANLLPALRAAAALDAAGDSSDDGPRPNVELGDFRIVRQVGRGGMGIVYEAEQLSLRRRVALKVLPFASTMDPKQLQRFRNEALAAASLHHEHIVPVYAVGCERGVHYYAMQFIDGTTLAQVIAGRTESRGRSEHGPDSVTGPYLETPSRPRPPDTAPVAALSTERTGPNGREFYHRTAELIADAADALEYAHSLGIVHRDIKPGNFMVDGSGKVWVADFGLARFGADAGLTMSGDLLGTLRYMAPEQALARHGLADHRVDVYGLGCTLYELLTGKPAVGGTDKADILRHLSFEEPVALRKREKAIPAEMETIALKCLAKNPNGRYASAGDLSADLRRYCEDKPIKAKPPGMRERTVRWVRRNRALTASVAVILLVCALAIAGSAGFFLRDRANRLALTEQKVAGAVAAARAALTAGDLVLAGHHAAEARGHLGIEASALSYLAADVDRVQTEIDTRRDDAARFQRFVKLAAEAQNRMTFGAEYDGERAGRDALAEYSVLEADDWQTRVQKSTLTPLQMQEVRETAYLTIVSLANLGLTVTKTQSNDASAERSLELLRRAESFHEPTRAFYVIRTDCFRRQGKNAEAEADAKRSELAPARTAWDHYVAGRAAQLKHDIGGAIRSYRATLSMQPDHYNALFVLAVCLESTKNYSEALGLFSACLALRPVQGRADVYCHRSYCYRMLGAIEAADADYAAAMNADLDSAQSQIAFCESLKFLGRPEDLVTVRRRIVAMKPNSPHALCDLGDALSAVGQRAEAETAYRQAMALSPNDVEAHMALGILLGGESGRLDEAEAEFRKVVAVRPNGATDFNRLGLLYSKLGRHKEAEAAYRRAIELKPGSANLHYNLGMALSALDRTDEAEAAYRRAIEVMPDCGWAHVRLGNLLERLDRYADAEAAWRHALELSPEYPGVLNGLAWILADCPDAARRDPQRAVELATKAVHNAADVWNFHNTLGITHYRTGQWRDAITDLRRSMALAGGDNEWNLFFLGMSHWQLGELDQARQYYGQAVERMEKSTWASSAKLRRVRAEAAELLGMREPPADAKPPPKP
jgi:serine/threonine protein kinase/tetratricopeptide (TPR) repeat protein